MSALSGEDVTSVLSESDSVSLSSGSESDGSGLDSDSGSPSLGLLNAPSSHSLRRGESGHTDTLTESFDEIFADAYAAFESFEPNSDGLIDLIPVLELLREEGKGPDDVVTSAFFRERGKSMAMGKMDFNLFYEFVFERPWDTGNHSDSTDETSEEDMETDDDSDGESILGFDPVEFQIEMERKQAMEREEKERLEKQTEQESAKRSTSPMTEERSESRGDQSMKEADTADAESADSSGSSDSDTTTDSESSSDGEDSMEQSQPQETATAMADQTPPSEVVSTAAVSNESKQGEHEVGQQEGPVDEPMVGGEEESSLCDEDKELVERIQDRRRSRLGQAVFTKLLEKRVLTEEEEIEKKERERREKWMEAMEKERQKALEEAESPMPSGANQSDDWDQLSPDDAKSRRRERRERAPRRPFLNPPMPKNPSPPIVSRDSAQERRRFGGFKRVEHEVTVTRITSSRGTWPEARSEESPTSRQKGSERPPWRPVAKDAKYTGTFSSTYFGDEANDDERAVSKQMLKEQFAKHYQTVKREAEALKQQKLERRARRAEEKLSRRMERDKARARDASERSVAAGGSGDVRKVRKKGTRKVSIAEPSNSRMVLISDNTVKYVAQGDNADAKFSFGGVAEGDPHYMKKARKKKKNKQEETADTGVGSDTLQVPSSRRRGSVSKQRRGSVSKERRGSMSHQRRGSVSETSRKKAIDVTLPKRLMLSSLTPEQQEQRAQLLAEGGLGHEFIHKASWHQSQAADLLRLGKLDGAKKQLKEGLKLMHKLTPHTKQAELLKSLANVKIRRGLLRRGLRDLVKSLAILKGLNTPADICADTHMILTDLLSRLGQHKKALGQAVQIIRYLSESPIPVQMPHHRPRSRSVTLWQRGKTKVLDKTGRFNRLCLAYQRLGVEYTILDMTELAKKAFYRGLQLARRELSRDSKISQSLEMNARALAAGTLKEQTKELNSGTKSKSKDIIKQLQTQISNKVVAKFLDLRQNASKKQRERKRAKEMEKLKEKMEKEEDKQPSKLSSDALRAIRKEKLIRAVSSAARLRRVAKEEAVSRDPLVRALSEQVFDEAAISGAVEGSEEVEGRR